MSALLPHRDAIAAAYDVLLTERVHGGVSSTEFAAWRELAEDSVDRAAGIRLLLDVHEVTDPEPYPDARGMILDIAAGRFRVSTANCEHPLWSAAENVAFRIVHDVLGHYAASIERARPGINAGAGLQPNRSQGQFVDADFVAGFDWSGEVAACTAHVRLLPRLARAALFTECLGQTAYAIARGGFPEQRVGFLGRYLEESGDASARDAYFRFTS